MTSFNLDDVDRGILHTLQRDARNYTTGEIAERVGVSSSTVSNRIHQLEDAGVIEGYQPIVNYDAAGYPFFVLVACTAPTTARTDLAEEALDIPGVVNVRLFLSGTSNFRVAVVGSSREDIANVVEELYDLGLTIEDSPLVEREYYQPFNHFMPPDPE